MGQSPDVTPTDAPNEPTGSFEASSTPEADPEPIAEPPNGPSTLFEGGTLAILTRSHVMLWPLAICSVATFGFALERTLALRRRRILPREFVERFLDRLQAGKLDRERALEFCKANDCAASRIIALAVRHWGQPGLTIRQIVAQDAAGEVVEWKRNVRVLQGAATIAPLLGLLGTVIGLIQAFAALGGIQGGQRGEALAEGISLALIATAAGLGIAVFALVTYYYLINRVDALVRELDGILRQVIDRIAGHPLDPLHALGTMPPNPAGQATGPESREPIAMIPPSPNPGSTFVTR